ncbi:MAG: PQQ-binding-like beta-propeller repeat protein, partial [Acidobacteriaceae bacterium]|nr:PQQ-binding-like beta-propeller repeat protein [Acidobacteriaceae bacterium]
PIPNVDKEPKADGALLNIPGPGGTNWFAPSFDPENGLFFVNATKGYSLAYLTDTDDHPEGYGGSGRTLWSQATLEAIDYKTGRIRWCHDFPGKGIAASGILSTAGRLLFSGDPSGNLIAWNPNDGRILWHVAVNAKVTNGPMTYMLDERQFVVAAAGDTLYAFALLSR